LKAVDKISAIIFDFGDVICFWSDESLSHERALSHGLPGDSLQRIFREYLRVGGVGTYHSMQDYYERGNPQTPVSREIAEQVFNEWDATAQVDQRMVGLITALKIKYKIGLLSNFSKGLEEYLVDRFGIHHLFDSIVSSYNIKMRKPDLDIYHHSANDLGVKAANCIFVDDKERNVVAAKQAGMQGIVFKNFDDLIPQLEAMLGMKVTVSD
jgi:HAD superfamily hydrolase (TIGR01509 family)